jgi:hypothetical protein
MTEMPQFAALPESVRSVMKLNINQGKQVFDTFISASQKALYGIDTSASSAAEGLKTLNDKLAGYARLNAETIFRHAMQLADARQFGDIVELQNAHARETMDRLTKQLEEIREMTTVIVKQTAQNVTTTLPVD